MSIVQVHRNHFTSGRAYQHMTTEITSEHSPRKRSPRSASGPADCSADSADTDSLHN